MAPALRSSTTDRLGRLLGQLRRPLHSDASSSPPPSFQCPCPFVLPVSTRAPVVFQVTVLNLLPQDWPHVTMLMGSWQRITPPAPLSSLAPSLPANSRKATVVQALEFDSGRGANGGGGRGEKREYEGLVAQ